MPLTYHHPLLLVRHAETALNAAGQIRGHLDPALYSAGERQASQLAATVSACQPLRIVSRPLRRATAAALSDLTGRPVEIDQRLIDQDYGQWAGQQRNDVEAEWGTEDQAPGVEPAENLST